MNVSNPPDLKPGLVSISFRSKSPEEILHALDGLPLQGIEWGGDVHVPHGDLETARCVGQRTRDAGLDPFCYGSYYRFRDVLSSGKEFGPEIEAVLDTAESLGARRVRLWAGEQDYEDADEATCRAVATRAHEIGVIADQRGLGIDLEFHGGTLNNSAGHSLELLGAINHANVKTLWQPSVGLSGEKRLQSLQDMLPQVSNIHCFHWGPGGFQERLALAEGISEWSAYLSVLKHAGLPRWVSLEYVRDDAFESLAEDARTLAGLIIPDRPHSQ
jgi:sugar phosphate isomerase/epimerase